MSLSGKQSVPSPMETGNSDETHFSQLSVQLEHNRVAWAQATRCSHPGAWELRRQRSRYHGEPTQLLLQ